MYPETPSEPTSNNHQIEQLQAEITEIKNTVMEIRKIQHRQTIWGVLKIVFYVALIGASIISLKGILSSGLENMIFPGAAFNNSDSTSTSSSLNPSVLEQLQRNLQDLQK